MAAGAPPSPPGSSRSGRPPPTGTVRSWVGWPLSPRNSTRPRCGTGARPSGPARSGSAGGGKSTERRRRTGWLSRRCPGPPASCWRPRRRPASSGSRWIRCTTASCTCERPRDPPPGKVTSRQSAFGCPRSIGPEVCATGRSRRWSARRSGWPRCNRPSSEPIPSRPDRGLRCQMRCRTGWSGTAGCSTGSRSRICCRNCWPRSTCSVARTRPRYPPFSCAAPPPQRRTRRSRSLSGVHCWPTSGRLRRPALPNARRSRHSRTRHHRRSPPGPPGAMTPPARRSGRPSISPTASTT